MWLMRAAVAALAIWLIPAIASAQARDIWIVGWSSRAELLERLEFVDASSIVTRGAVRRAWSWSYYSPDLRPPSDYAFVVSLVEYDCVERRSRPLQASGYSATGEATQIFGGASPGSWGFAVPGTFGAGVLDFVCASVQQRIDNADYMQLPEGVQIGEAAYRLFRRD